MSSFEMTEVKNQLERTVVSAEIIANDFSMVPSHDPQTIEEIAKQVEIKVTNQAHVLFALLSMIRHEFEERQTVPYAVLRKAIHVIVNRQLNHMATEYIVLVKGLNGVGDFTHTEEASASDEAAEGHLHDMVGKLLKGVLPHLLMTNDTHKQYIDAEAQHAIDS